MAKDLRVKMSGQGKGKEILTNLSWKFAERILAQGVSTIVSILLARMLLPDDYGMITMVLVFINIANVFVTSGFGQSLIQDRESADMEFSTMTFVSLAVSIVLYFIIFISAPYIARFYGMQELCSVLRVLALKLPLAGYNSIQHAYVQKHMLFKKFFFSTLGGTIVSGVVGVVMAYYGFGVWALVAQYLTNSVIDTIVLCVTISWKPKMMYSNECLHRLFSFSWKLTGGDLIGAVYNELRALIIGKVYSSSDLAFFNRGEQFPNLIINNINSSIISVLYPAMAQVNDVTAKVKEMTRKSIRASAFFLFPLLVGLSVVAEPFVRVVLTEKWIGCIPYLRIACFTQITVPLSSANLQALKAMGRSDITMKLEFIKKVTGLILIISTMRFGVIAIALSGLVYSIIAVVANATPNKKVLDYSYAEQCRDLLPFASMSAIMGGFVYAMGFMPINDVMMIALQVFAGFVIYVGLAVLTRNDIMVRCIAVIKKRSRRK